MVTDLRRSIVNRVGWLLILKQQTQRQVESLSDARDSSYQTQNTFTDEGVLKLIDDDFIRDCCLGLHIIQNQWVPVGNKCDVNGVKKDVSCSGGYETDPISRVQKVATG